MKYIRTKNGVFKVVDILTDGRIKVCTVPNLKRFTRVHETKDIVKQADTIEDLCDEFVIDYGRTNPTKYNQRYAIYYDFDEVKKEIYDREHNFGRYLDGNDFIVYGAIWTTKGLIYVAKMNKKGEFELI